MLLAGFLVFLAGINGWHEIFLEEHAKAAILIAVMLSVGFGGILAIAATIVVQLSLFIFSGLFEPPSLVESTTLLVCASIVGVYSAGLMHHASHNHFGSPLINRLVGELCALHQLIGFFGWKIPHIAHHLNADIEGKDPHAPAGMGFFQYSSKIKSDVLQTLKDSYLETFPNENGPLIWKCSFALIWINRMLRVLFWYAVLGFEYFILFFVTSYFVQLTFYVHFNWVTHKKSDSGEYLIKDIDEGLYYRCINKIMWGMFYHGTHHKFPYLMDPRLDTSVVQN